MGALRLLDGAVAGERHQGEVFTCAYAPDGAFVLSGGWDGWLRLWEPSSGAHVAALSASPKPLSACGFTPDGKQWLAGTMEGLLSFWDVLSHRSLFNFVAHTRPISALRYSPDGQLLATTSWDRNLCLRKAGHEREVGRTLVGHDDIVAGCVFTPNGKQLLSWSHDRTVRLWDVELAREVCVFRGHADRVASASVSPDGRWAVSGGRDGVLRLWDLPTQAETANADLGREVRGCFFLLDGESLVTVDASGRLLLLALPRFEVQAQLNTSLKVMCGELAPSGAQLALGCENGEVRFAAIDGLEGASLIITATQRLKPATGLFARLTGSTRLRPMYEYTCPACRQATETATLPSQPVSCPKCRRRLVVNAHELVMA
jgi:WD40 repeat protein